MLENAMEVVGKIIVLVNFQSFVHNLKQLFFTRIVYFSNCGFNLIKPVLNRIELRRVRRKIENLHATLFS
jgi:hypothetical protein